MGWAYTILVGTLEKLLLQREIMRCEENINMDLRERGDVRVTDSGSCPMAGSDTGDTGSPSVNTASV
jgi:hypothetical protein